MIVITPLHWAIDRNSECGQKTPYSLSDSSVKTMPLQLRDKNVVWDISKCFAQVQVVVMHQTLPALLWNASELITSVRWQVGNRKQWEQWWLQNPCLAGVAQHSGMMLLSTECNSLLIKAFIQEVWEQASISSFF